MLQTSFHQRWATDVGQAVPDNLPAVCEPARLVHNGTPLGTIKGLGHRFS